MTIDILVSPRMKIGVATSISGDEALRDINARREVAVQAINHVLSLDPYQLKALIVQGLIDAQNYPLDFTEIDSWTH